MAYRIKFDRSKCVGCYACHMACLDAHYIAEEENAVSFRTTVKFIDREKDFEKNICPGVSIVGSVWQPVRKVRFIKIKRQVSFW